MSRLCSLLLLLVLTALPLTSHAVQLGKIAAVVNGKVITMYDLQRAAVPELAQARAKDSKTIDRIMRRVLDNMILDILVAQEAKRLKITISKSEVDDRIAEIMKQNRLTKAQFEAQLAKDGMSVKELRSRIERQLLNQRVLGVEVGRRTVVLPEEVKAYYEEHKDTLYDRKGLHMGVLIYHPKAPAETVAGQLARGEISFASACAKYSVLPNRDKGGDTGPVEWDKLNQEWGERLSKMKPGTVSNIFMNKGFKTQVYLFRPEGGPYKIMTLKEATPMITGILRQPKSKDRFDEYAAQLKKKAVIDIRL
ncbi:MAG: SurA N-terminal domain-containing protein [Desulfovibrio sp.]|nr:SurA N-terminal domain-containing protein [Desulfovibrio sp.]